MSIFYSLFNLRNLLDLITRRLFPANDKNGNQELESMKMEDEFAHETGLDRPNITPLYQYT